MGVLRDGEHNGIGPKVLGSANQELRGVPAWSKRFKFLLAKCSRRPSMKVRRYPLNQGFSSSNGFVMQSLTYKSIIISSQILFVA